MKVFLGWSGTRSKEAAEALGEWLGQVIQAVDPWISSDISKGARWGEEISDELEEAKVGIICLTRENLNENWILFEAGALSKTKDAYVCTFLLDLTPTDIKPPLALFQHTKFEEEDIRKLAHTINQAVKDAGEHSLDEKRLYRIFDHFWSDLEDGLKKIVEKHAEVKQPIREDREILEEILGTLRAQERRVPHVFPIEPTPVYKEYIERLETEADKNPPVLESHHVMGAAYRPIEKTINVGDIYDVTIEDVGREGDGITRIGGYVAFVPNVKKGDSVRIRVKKTSRRVAFAEVVAE